MIKTLFPVLFHNLSSNFLYLWFQPYRVPTSIVLSQNTYCNFTSIFIPSQDFQLLSLLFFVPSQAFFLLSQDCSYCPSTFCQCPKTPFPSLVSQDYCPKTTVPRLLSQDYCPKTSVPRLVSQDYCPKTTVPRLLSQD